MSNKHVRTPADLIRFKCGAAIDCATCGCSKHVSGLEIFKQFGSTPLSDCAKRLKCSRCGKKAARVTVLLPP